MRFWLYQLLGDKRYLDKTEYLNALYNEGEQNDYFDGVIIDDTSVIEPTFKFSRHKYWKRCNYLFCQDTLRYYYVTDVTLSQGYVYVKCHVDVLMTFRNTLKERNIILKRTGNSAVKKKLYNRYLQDEKYKAYAMPKVLNYNFNAPAHNPFNMKVQEFVLCVVGKNSGEEPNGGDS